MQVNMTQAKIAEEFIRTAAHYTNMKPVGKYTADGDLHYIWSLPERCLICLIDKHGMSQFLYRDHVKKEVLVDDWSGGTLSNDIVEILKSF